MLPGLEGWPCRLRPSHRGDDGAHLSSLRGVAPSAGSSPASSP